LTRLGRDAFSPQFYCHDLLIWPTGLIGT